MTLARLGIMQGRLTDKPADRLQSFPHASWREEFSRARALGFGAVEWLVDDDGPDGNPLMTEAGRETIRARVGDTGVEVATACLHYFISGALWADDADRRARAGEELARILEACDRVGVKKAVIPAMDGASLASAEARTRFEMAFPALLDRLGTDCALLLETDLPASELGEVIAMTDGRVGVCFDIGNVTALGFDLAFEFRAQFDWLGEVHIKDRLVGGGTRLLGEGDTDLALAGALAAELGYEGPVTLETPVVDDWERAGRHNVDKAREAFRRAS